jgi:metal-sulfur cluster biosynthetic enzyme
MSITTNDPMKSLIAESALRLVFDPEIGINIVDLGLVYDIRFNEEEKRIVLRMTLTTEFCPMGESIVRNTEETMQTAFPGYEILVELTFDPAWSYDLISQEGKEFLTM